MRTLYTDLNIHFTIENTEFFALNIVFERFMRPVPRHSHGHNSYEIHYISQGKGTVIIDEETFQVIPGTLYVTGPHVEHEQKTDKNNPMEEYCIYLKAKQKNVGTQKNTNDKYNLVSAFLNTPKWFGRDSQDLYPLLLEIFQELESACCGYTIQIETLLTQCIVKMVRNYLDHQDAVKHFPVTNLVDSKYIITEESFLYDYRNITLQTLAKRLGLSTRQTERFLRETYGKTFLRKKTEARMSAASIFLVDSNMSITDIAFHTGYSSLEHFSHAFKQYYGISAVQYRAQHT